MPACAVALGLCHKRNALDAHMSPYLPHSDALSSRLTSTTMHIQLRSCLLEAHAKTHAAPAGCVLRPFATTRGTTQLVNLSNSSPQSNKSKSSPPTTVAPAAPALARASPAVAPGPPATPADDAAAAASPLASPSPSSSSPPSSPELASCGPPTSVAASSPSTRSDTAAGAAAGAAALDADPVTEPVNFIVATRVRLARLPCCHTSSYACRPGTHAQTTRRAVTARSGVAYALCRCPVGGGARCPRAYSIAKQRACACVRGACTRPTHAHGRYHRGGPSGRALSTSSASKSLPPAHLARGLKEDCVAVRLAIFVLSWERAWPRVGGSKWRVGMRQSGATTQKQPPPRQPDQRALGRAQPRPAPTPLPPGASSVWPRTHTLVLRAGREVIGAYAMLLALLPRAAVAVAIGIRVDAVVWVRRPIPLAIELLPCRHQKQSGAGGMDGAGGAP